MNNIYFITFAAGAISGAAASYVVLKKKYEKLINEEVEKANETFKKYYKNGYKEPCIKPVKDDVSLYKDYVNEIKGTEEPEKEGEYFVVGNEKPYIITPTQFGEFDDYKIVTLYYNEKNKVVTDEKGYEIGNYKTIIGDEFPGHFGEYEEDSVYVRNENTETDYEILLDSSEDNLE